MKKNNLKNNKAIKYLMIALIGIILVMLVAVIVLVIISISMSHIPGPDVDGSQSSFYTKDSKI